jgi:hypothetical protein
MNLVKDLQAEDQNKIKQGQSILSKQQHLLSQLLEKKPTSTNSTTPWQSMLSFFVPAPTIIIKQTLDNTTYSLQGVCTTMDPTFIPHQVKNYMP